MAIILKKRDERGDIVDYLRYLAGVALAEIVPFLIWKIFLFYDPKATTLQLYSAPIRYTSKMLLVLYISLLAVL